jgi:hypothetical protein
MSIREEEEALFEEWANGNPVFVRDGVVDEGSYRDAPLKILLLLKEVNDPDGGGWDLRQFLGEEGGRSQTWSTVTRWLQGIRSTNPTLCWSDFVKVTSEVRKRELKSIAAMNLKKTPGGHTSQINRFWETVIRDAQNVKKQFELYDADVVICCGSSVTSAFKSFIQPGSNWRSTTRGVEFLEYKPSQHVIAFSHPEARVAENLLFYGLVDAVRAIRGILRLT